MLASLFLQQTCSVRTKHGRNTELASRGLSLEVDAVELIETAPRSRGSNTLEEFAHGLGNS